MNEQDDDFYNAQGDEEQRTYRQPVHIHQHMRIQINWFEFALAIAILMYLYKELFR